MMYFYNLKLVSPSLVGTVQMWACLCRDSAVKYSASFVLKTLIIVIEVPQSEMLCINMYC